LNSQRLYYLKLSFSSTNPEWVGGYLTNPDFRLTAILKDLKNEFWENFAAQRRISLNTKQLLLRTKHIDLEHGNVILSQIYREKAGYDLFLRESSGGLNLETLFREKGISMAREESFVSESFGPELLVEVQKYPHIIQYLIDKWQTEGMPIGDPLKKGRLYLPDPGAE
jgi:hypothetical protein